MSDPQKEQLTTTEDLVFSALLSNQEYFYRVFPFLKEEYFEEGQKVLFKTFKYHFDKYDKPPTREILEVYLSTNKHINERLFEAAKSFLFSLKETSTDYETLIDLTEKFCQDKALYLALARSVSIYDKETTEAPKSSIPEILNEALGVSFNTDIGLDYIDDAKKRYDWLHEKHDKIPFRIDILNEITDGGFEHRTVNIFLASTGVGKSAIMCHLASDYAQDGKSCLYLSMEMAEAKIAQRIDANLFGKTISQVKNMSESEFMTNINYILKKGIGKIKIKEFPTASVHMGHIETILRELKLKKGFVPDVVFLDYLNICLSKRIGLGAGSYTFVKAIIEEFRGLASKYDFIGITATQGDRSTIESSDIGLQNVSESKGINDTADFMLGLMAPEDVKSQGIMLCKQLKSRYGDVNYKKRFTLLFDSEKMLFEDSDGLSVPGFNSPKDDKSAGEDIPLFDKGTKGRYLSEGDKTKKLLEGTRIKF